MTTLEAASLGHAQGRIGPSEEEINWNIMEWIVTTARTVEEAQSALDLLGVDHDDAEIQVIEEGKTGLFGRTKSDARVRARIKPKATWSRKNAVAAVATTAIATATVVAAVVAEQRWRQQQQQGRSNNRNRNKGGGGNNRNQNDAKGTTAMP